MSLHSNPPSSLGDSATAALDTEPARCLAWLSGTFFKIGGLFQNKNETRWGLSLRNVEDLSGNGQDAGIGHVPFPFRRLLALNGLTNSMNVPRRADLRAGSIGRRRVGCAGWHLEASRYRQFSSPSSTPISCRNSRRWVFRCSDYLMWHNQTRLPRLSKNQIKL